MSATGAPLLSPAARPYALAPLRIGVDGTGSIELGWCELHFPPRAAATVTAFLGAATGDRALPAVAVSLGWPEERAVALASTLYAKGAVADAEYRDVPAALAHTHLVAWGRMLRARMSSDADLLSARPHRRLLLGSLIETYHFVASASYHIGAAVAHAPSAQVRDALSGLFVDEWKHGAMLAGGLMRAGLSRDEISDRQPLPQTKAVINYLRALAASDLLSYGICAAVNESPKSDVAIKESWDKLIALDLLPREALWPFRGHELEDEASGHAEIAALLFADHAVISTAQQRRIRAHVEAFIATQSACYAALKQAYGEPKDDRPAQAPQAA